MQQILIESYKTSSNSWADAIELACLEAATGDVGTISPLRKIYELERTVKLHRSNSYNNICNIHGVSGGAPQWRKPEIHGTVFKALGDFPAFEIATYDNLQFLGQVKLSNFSIVGNTAQDSYIEPPWSSMGIKFGDGGAVRQIIMDNIQISNCHVGLFGILSELFMSNCRVSACKYSTWFQSIVDSDITTTHFGSGTWNNWVNGGTAFHANYCHNTNFHDFVRFQVQKGGYGATFKDLQSSMISNCIIDQNEKRGISITSGNDVTLTGNKFIANNEGATYIRGVNNLHIGTSNTFRETAEGGPPHTRGFVQDINWDIEGSVVI